MHLRIPRGGWRGVEIRQVEDLRHPSASVRACRKRELRRATPRFLSLPDSTEDFIPLHFAELTGGRALAEGDPARKLWFDPNPLGIHSDERPFGLNCIERLGERVQLIDGQLRRDTPGKDQPAAMC